MIKVLLPNADAITGLNKTCTHVELLIRDNVIISTRQIEFVDSEGNRVIPTNDLQSQQLSPKIVRLSTAGLFVDSQTGQNVSPEHENAVPEIDYLQSIPLSAVPEQITTVWGAVKWMIETSMIQGNVNGRY